MKSKKLLVVRVYNQEGKLIGCGIHNKKTHKTECLAIKDVIKMIDNFEIENIMLGDYDKLEGVNGGEQEFNRLPATIYTGGNSVNIADPRIYILSFDKKTEYPVIKPDGSYALLKTQSLISAIKNNEAKPSNFIITNGEIIDAYSESYRDLDKLSVAVVSNLCKKLGINGGRHSLEFNGYSIEIEPRGKNDGLSIKIDKSIDIQKYATPENYPFIFREYDNNLFINREYAPQQYDNILSKYNQKFIKFELRSKQLANIQDRQCLSLGDKNWLTADHYVGFYIPINTKSKYSLKDMHAITEIMLTIFKRK